MGFRFRKSVKIMPGVRLNLSNKGVSATVGGRGASVNVGRKGVRTSVGVPGSGLSHSTFTPYRGRGAGTPPKPVMGTLGVILTFVLVIVALLFGMALIEHALGIAPLWP